MKDKLRMAQWLLLAAMCYTIALNVPWPQVQTLCWKLGNVTVASFIGYWVDRRAFSADRVTLRDAPLYHIRRAIIIAAAMIAVSLGL